jgi:hypothetical protein
MAQDKKIGFLLEAYFFYIAIDKTTTIPKSKQKLGDKQ